MFDGARPVLGKDSVRYLNTTEVLPDAYRALSGILEGLKGTYGNATRSDTDSPGMWGGKEGVTPSVLNDHLHKFMPGLSAKVFRTYNASMCLDNEFHKHPVDPTMSLAEKVAYFTSANTKVAILCNHQKDVSKTYGSRMADMEEKVSYATELKARTEKVIAMLPDDTEDINNASEKVKAKALARRPRGRRIHRKRRGKNEMSF